MAHCGGRLQGGCLYTITLTDVATGWTVCLPLLIRGREAVLAALQRARALFPFPILGLDTDNGGEFIKEEVAAYCVREQITFTRGRPYEKRDQCFVEQKNGVVVRQVVGHGRLTGEHAYRQLDELYRALHWYVNCFQPSMKLVSTQVEGRKIRRIYDAAKTPLQRVLLSGALSPAQQQELRTIGKAFDPLWLFQQVEQMQQATLRCEAGRSSAGQPTPQTSLVPFDLAACAAELILQEGLDEPEVVSLLGLRLKPCQWCILYLLLEHPLLSDEELAAFLGIQRRSVRCSLYELHQLGCLDSVLTAALTRWCLCERGLRLVAVANSRHIRNIAEMPDGLADMEASKLKQRGERWLLQHIRHTAGIYGFFAALALTTRKEAGHELCWWETGAMCERRYRVGEQWYNLRPDALAEYRIGSQLLRFWLEWDRGTMNVRDLAIKFTSYAHYIASREWARECSIPLALLCIAPDIAQERRIMRIAQARLTHSPELVLWTTTELLLNEYGPLAGIWLKHISQCGHDGQSHGLIRQIIFGMIPEQMVT